MTDQNAAPEAPETPASASPVPASPAVVDAPPSAAAPGADIVGHSEQPLPGAQPGIVGDTPVVAQSVADPHPEDSVTDKPAPDAVKPQSADDPNPEATALGSTDPAVHNPRPPLDAPGPDLNDGDFSEAEIEFAPEDEHPSRQPVALRPAPAGPSSERYVRPNPPLRRSEVEGAE